MDASFSRKSFVLSQFFFVRIILQYPEVSQIPILRGYHHCRPDEPEILDGFAVMTGFKLIFMAVFRG